MFVDFKCGGEKYYKSGAFEAIICPVDNQPCIYSGYCIERKRIRHTEKAKTCLKRENISNNGVVVDKK